MPIQADTDKIRQLTIFTVSGDLDFEGLLGYMKSYCEDFSLTKKCLWDFHSATGGEVITENQLGFFASVLKMYAFESPVSKMGFVIHGDLGFGLAQMLSTFEELYDVALDAKSFLTMEDAMGWLENE